MHDGGIDAETVTPVRQSRAESEMYTSILHFSQPRCQSGCGRRVMKRCVKTAR